MMEDRELVKLLVAGTFNHLDEYSAKVSIEAGRRSFNFSVDDHGIASIEYLGYNFEFIDMRNTSISMVNYILKDVEKTTNGSTEGSLLSILQKSSYSEEDNHTLNLAFKEGLRILRIVIPDVNGKESSIIDRAMLQVKNYHQFIDLCASTLAVIQIYCAYTTGVMVLKEKENKIDHSIVDNITRNIVNNLPPTRH